MESIPKSISIKVTRNKKEIDVQVNYFLTTTYLNRASADGTINLVARLLEPEIVDLRDVISTDNMNDEQYVQLMVVKLVKNYFES